MLQNILTLKMDWSGGMGLGKLMVDSYEVIFNLQAHVLSVYMYLHVISTEFDHIFLHSSNI